MPDSLLADDAYLALLGRTFSAAEVIEACELTGDQLTNYLSKSRVLLCSEPPGRGKARKYALIDVYMIGLIARSTEITRRQDWSVRSIEYLLYLGPDETRKTYPLNEMVSFPAERLEETRHRLRESPASAHKLFTHRNWRKSSWLIFAEFDLIEAGLYGFKLVNSAGSAKDMRTIETGYLINATAALWRIDQALIRNSAGQTA